VQFFSGIFLISLNMPLVGNDVTKADFLLSELKIHPVIILCDNEFKAIGINLWYF
jgi:hypothetical protein